MVFIIILEIDFLKITFFFPPLRNDLVFIMGKAGGINDKLTIFEIVYIFSP